MYNTGVISKGGRTVERFGFIHEKLDIKLLILFVLRRLPGAVEPNLLSDLCRQCDDGVGYFDYSDCLAELIDTGHIAESEEGLAITEKGTRNIDLVESSLPYSVRSKAVKLLEPERQRLRRLSMIKASHTVEEGGCFVRLAMSDGEGDIIRLELLCGGEEQAKKIESNFRNGAEGYYHQFIELLTK